MSLSRFVALPAVLAALVLGGCGYTPLYGSPATPALAAMEIDAGEARVDYLLEDALKGAYGSAAGPSPYRLAVATELSERRLGVSAADRATRYALVLTVNYALSERGVADPVSVGQVQETVYFDAPREPYAITSARRDAEARAAEAAAERIARALAAEIR